MENYRQTKTKKKKKKTHNTQKGKKIVKKNGFCNNPFITYYNFRIDLVSTSLFLFSFGIPCWMTNVSDNAVYVIRMDM